MSSRRKKQPPARRAPMVAPGQDWPPAGSKLFPPSLGRNPWRLDRAAAFHLLVLSAVSFALYARTLGSGFVADDEFEVLQDPLIRSFAKIPALFAHGIWFFAGARDENYYRPLKLLVYMIEYHLFGFHPGLWHLANILLNLAVVLVIYFLVRDLAFHLPSFAEATEGVPAVVPPCGTKAGQLAFWSALFFAFHPIHVEAVAWVAAGNDLLCGLALLLALWLYHRARVAGLGEARAGVAAPPVPRGGGTAAAKAGPYSASVALFFAGLLFKETALTFPGIIVCYDFFYRGETMGEVVRGWRRYVTYVTALGGYLVLRVLALRSFAPGANRFVHLTFKDLTLSIPVLAVKYLWKSLLPINQSWWYVYEPIRTLGWQPIAAIAVVLVLVFGMFWLRGRESSGRRREPVLSLALAWFWLTLIPVLDIPRLSSHVFSERYLYIPSFGFCIFAARAWLRLHDHVAGLPAEVRQVGKAGLSTEVPQGGTKVGRAAAYACLLVLLAFYTAVILRRLPDWHDSVRLLTRTAQQWPNASDPETELSLLYRNRGLLSEALEHSERAVALAPASARAHNDLANMLVALGRNEAARGEVEKAVALDPTYAVARNNLGSILWALGHPEQAAAEAQKAAELDPSFSPFWSNLCLIYTHQKQWGRAAEACGRAIQLGPLQFNSSLLDTRIDFAISLVHLGQLDAAADQLVTGLRAEPDSSDAFLGHYELGVIYRYKRLWQQAMEQFQTALNQNPGYAPARDQLEAVSAHLANPQH